MNLDYDVGDEAGFLAESHQDRTQQTQLAELSPRSWLVSVEAAGSCDNTAVEGFIGYPCGSCNSPGIGCSELGQTHVDAGKRVIEKRSDGLGVTVPNESRCPNIPKQRCVLLIFLLFLFFFC